MEILDFLKDKKAEIDYEVLCKKIIHNNFTEIPSDLGTKVEGRLGDLYVTYNDHNQEYKLFMNKEVVFHKEDIYTDSIVHINNLDKVKEAKQEYKDSLKEKKQNKNRRKYN